MNKKVLFLFFILILSSGVVFSASYKDDDVPPWMEVVDKKGKGRYLIPKGAKKTIVGKHITVESPNEYTARQLYEMRKELAQKWEEQKELNVKMQKVIDELKGKLEVLEEKLEEKQKEDI